MAVRGARAHPPAQHIGRLGVGDTPRRPAGHAPAVLEAGYLFIYLHDHNIYGLEAKNYKS